MFRRFGMYGGFNSFYDDGVDRRDWADKSSAALRRENLAIKAFDEARATMEARNDLVPGKRENIQLLKPSCHLTAECLKTFRKHVLSFPGWNSRRRVATDEEKKKHGETRMGRVYFTDVSYRVPSKEKEDKANTSNLTSFFAPRGNITNHGSPSNSTSFKESSSTLAEPDIGSIEPNDNENRENVPPLVNDNDWIPAAVPGTSTSNQKAKSLKRPVQSSVKDKVPPAKKKRMTKLENIEAKLKSIGDTPGEGVGNCARAAIYKGFIKMKWEPSDLDQIIMSDKLDCGHTIDVTLRDLLEQPDYGGNDYEDGLQYASVYCKEEDCSESESGRTYVTRICSGNPQFDSGKFHNHCNECKNFGTCIGDYREAHCNRCGKHYWKGFGVQSSCPCRGRGRGFSIFGF